MKQKSFIRVTALFLSLCLLFACTGCAASQNLMKDAQPNPVAKVENLNKDSVIITDLAVRLFQAVNEGEENTLLSPMSVLFALAMTANGAKGDTLNQMSAVLGMEPEQLNPWLYSYRRNLPQSDDARLSIANSIWIAEDRGVNVKPEFLQCTADYYAADIYKTPFNAAALKDINRWVDEKTDGMIPKILDRIEQNTVMYLINALAFEAQWSKPYADYQVHPGTFTKANGETEDAQFMYSQESVYLQDENAQGFLKHYKGGDYAFVALLPNEGMAVEDYVNSLTGEKLQALLANAEYAEVSAGLPKFESEYTVELSRQLQDMGMVDAFSGEKADLSGISEGLFISLVLHKTYISVGEQGTRAGAVTVVANDAGCTPDPEPKTVTLNRPFVYMLIDTKTNIPFFIGTMMTPGGLQ